jgi:hypothetical protein
VSTPPCYICTTLTFLSRLLKKCLIKCQLNASSKGDRGDVGRMYWYLSKALRMKGDPDADENERLAKSIRRECQGARFDQLEDEDDSYELMVFVPFR